MSFLHSIGAFVARGKKHRTGRWWLPVTIDTVLLVCGLIVLGVAAPSTTLHLETVTAQFEGRDEQEMMLPLSMQTDGPRLFVHAVMERGFFSPTRLLVRPDDCIEEIWVNDVPVPDLPPVERFCYEQQWQRVNLAPVLNFGTNDVEFTIRTGGGAAGLHVQQSFLNPPFLLLILGLFLLPTAYALRWLRRLGRSWHASVLTILIAAGLMVRLLLSSHPGHGSDLGINQGWARSAVELGLAHSYREQVNGNMLPNYPPLSLSMFGTSGWIYERFFTPDYSTQELSRLILIKLPALIADMLTVLLLYFLIKRGRGKSSAIFAAGIYAFHPAVIYNGAIWGQVDSVYTLFMVATIAAISSRQWILTGAMLMCALFSKMQAVVVLPTLGLCLLAAKKRAWWQFAGGLVAASAVILLPFIPQYLPDVWNVYTGSVGYYPSLASGAYNLWTALYSNTGRSDLDLLFGLLSYRQIGFILFATTLLVTAAITWQSIRRSVRGKANAELLLLSAAITAYGFFVFNTEMHERYLFPLMALGLPLIFLSWRGAALYALSSLGFLLNLLGVLPFSEFDRALFREFTYFPSFIGALHVFLICAWITLLLSAPATRTRTPDSPARA